MDTTLWLAFAAQLAVFGVALRWLVHATDFDERVYRSPSILLAAIRRRSLQAFLLATTAPFLLALPSTSWSAHSIPALMPFALFLAAVIAWAGATYRRNDYFDRSHAFDRLVLAALAIAIAFHPVAIGPFVAATLTIHRQFAQHRVLPPLQWTDRRPLLDMLLLYVAHAWWTALSGAPASEALLLAILCAAGAHYLYPGIAKLIVGRSLFVWLRHNDLGRLAVNSWVFGWLSFLPEETIVQAARAFSKIRLPLTLGVLAIELSAVAIAFDDALSLSLLTLFVLMHLAIFVSSGVFFWKWILLDAALVALISTLDPSVKSSVFGLQQGAIVAAGALAAPLWLKPFILGWFDSPCATAFRLEMLDEDGDWKAVSAHAMAPYDIVFAQCRFSFLLPEGAIVGTYGVLATTRPNAQETIDAMERVVDGDLSYDDMRARWKIDSFNQQARDGFERFLLSFAAARNRAGWRRPWWRALAAAPHLYNRARPPAGVPHRVRAIRVRLVETFFDGVRVNVVRDKVCARVDITNDRAIVLSGLDPRATPEPARQAG